MLTLTELEPDSDNARNIAAAEQKMLDACQPLNDLASAHRDNKPLKRRAAARAITNCKTATASTKSLLPPPPP